MTPSGRENVPVFKLYGETRQWPTPDLLHCESIAERSRLHDWHIKPHRHADLLHVLHIASGKVTLELEGSEHHADGATLIVIPAMAIHGFRFSQDIQGHVVTLAEPLVLQLVERLGHNAGALAKPAYYRLTKEDDKRRIAALVGQVHDEYRQPAQGRDILLDALIQALAVQLVRRADSRRHAAAIAGQQARGQTHLQHFQTLIEAQYREQPTIEVLSAQLGVTSAHLNTLCRRLAGRSALQLLHERVLLEAKRELTYTNMTVSQVADNLGFSEPAYFTRFFKRHTGFSPRDFRLRQSEA